MLRLNDDITGKLPENIPFGEDLVFLNSKLLHTKIGIISLCIVIFEKRTYSIILPYISSFYPTVTFLYPSFSALSTYNSRFHSHFIMEL